jgi:enoyl-CoA hydratase
VAGPANGHEPTNAAGEPLVLVDDPAPGVRRITLNRPEKRNALNNPLRGALIAALRDADGDGSVRVSIVRGAGTCFSAGYDLGGGNEAPSCPSSRPRARASGRAT